MNSIPVLYENDEIYVINKPAGLAVQGGEKISHSLDDVFSAQVGKKVYLVHRLDKETCGLMIVAKSSSYAAKWTKLISSKAVKKEYTAICCGRLQPEKGIISENVVQHGEKRDAVTKYSVEKKWHFESSFIDSEEKTVVFATDFCIVRLLLETGRMHQIRIHLAKQGCPIAGDDQHGDFKLNKKLKKTLKVKNLLLCSRKLTVPDFSLQKKELVFEIELPDYMESVISAGNFTERIS